jgi:hypothetical protein
VLIAIALVEVIKQENEKFKVDALDWCMLIAFVYAGVQLVWHPLNLQVLLGFKYDLLPLLAFFFLRRVDWSDRFRESAKKILLVMGAIVAVYGLITLLVPMSFFTWLGYSDLHSLYVPHGSLAAFQQIGGTAIRRIQSTMSGPNQLGLWLLIPVSIVMEAVMKRKKVISGQWVVGSVMIAALLMTFSRAAK